jgi:methyl coenzyme M reductase subunit D
MINIKNPEIEKHLVVSTVHISIEDSKLLDESNDNSSYVSADPTPFGWRVYIGVDVDTRKTLKRDGYTDEFINIFDIAKSLKCKWINFDCDGPQYDELKQFNWED